MVSQEIIRGGEILRSKPKVMVLGFGGTIAMARSERGVLHPAYNIDEVLAEAPFLNELADVKFRQLQNRDSSNITPRHWKQLARHIENIHHLYSGIIVTHGTDTMAYTASAVALALGRGLKIPVVFTGSTLPLTKPNTDARHNLENAMRTVIAASQEGVAEVMIVFADKVLRGARAVKVSETKFQAFDSPAFPDIASITRTGVSFQPFALRKEEKLPLDVKPEFRRFIFTVDLVPGLERRILQNIIRSGYCGGLVLKSFGAGTLPSEGGYSLLPVIKEAKGQNIPVVIATKFTGGNINLELYEPGKKALNLGAISAGDMTDIMAQVKLMWLLGDNWRRKIHLSLGELKEKINTDFVGEITV